MIAPAIAPIPAPCTELGPRRSARGAGDGCCAVDNGGSAVPASLGAAAPLIERSTSGDVIVELACVELACVELACVELVCVELACVELLCAALRFAELLRVAVFDVASFDVVLLDLDDPADALAVTRSDRACGPVCAARAADSVLIRVTACTSDVAALLFPRATDVPCAGRPVATRTATEPFAMCG